MPALMMLAGCDGEVSEFPSKPITIVVPWSAGGGTDALARALDDDPAAAAEYAERARLLREIRDQDQALALGTGPAMEVGEAPRSSSDGVVRGFLEVLDELEGN